MAPFVPFFDFVLNIVTATINHLFFGEGDHPGNGLCLLLFVYRKRELPAGLTLYTFPSIALPRLSRCAVRLTSRSTASLCIDSRQATYRFFHLTNLPSTRIHWHWHSNGRVGSIQPFATHDRIRPASWKTLLPKTKNHCYFHSKRCPHGLKKHEPRRQRRYRRAR